MKYRLQDLIDIKKLEKLMMEFYNITKIPYALINTEGNILSGVGWQKVCTKFHRIGLKSSLRCRESDLAISNRVNTDKEFTLCKCKNGLMEAAVPIIVEGNYMGMLCLGQFLLEEPDIEFFQKQGEEFGYDIESYMEAVSEIPIFTRDKIESSMAYYFQLAQMLSQMGFNQLKQKETEDLLIKMNEKLEDEVVERTVKLAIANRKLKKDIKKRKTILRELEESEKRYRRLVEIIPDSIIVYSQGNIIFTNPAFAKLVGIKNYERLIGRSLLDFIHPDDHSISISRAKYIKNGQILPLVEQKIIGSDGNSIEVEVTGAPLKYKGKPAVLVVARDISERKRIEGLQKKIEREHRMLKEAREYEKLKTEFFANLSHEFRTPLNLIYSTMQLFEQDIKYNLIKEEKFLIDRRMKVLKKNTYRLLRLSNNLLDITKIDSGYFQLKLENCNIVSIVEDITISAAKYLESKNIRVLFDTDVEENIIAIDVNAIERIILNLLSNAVKFSSPDGEILVNIYTNNENVSISVKDTGIGIPQDKQKIIFDRFRQVNKSLTRNHEGSGIGLSLAKSLVNLHDGEIIVRSEYKKGSEFIIKLPRKQVNKEDTVEIDYKQKDINGKNVEAIDIEFSDIYLSNSIS